MQMKCVSIKRLERFTSLVLSKDGGISVTYNDMAVMKCRRSRGYEKETNYKVPPATNNLAG